MIKSIRPTVWRRLLVPDCSLATLHEVIQVAIRLQEWRKVGP